MHVRVPFHFNPVRELEGMIRALGIFKRNKIPIEEKAHALYLYMAGLSSWEIADAMGDRYGRKPSHSSVLNWARALGSVGWTIPPRERRLIAVDETVEKVNGREVYVWAAIDVDTRELLAIRATWSRSSLDALLFLSRVLGACTNKPVFVVDRGPWYSWAFQELGLEYYHETFGDRSRVERFFGSLKRRTRVFFNNINARRSRIASLDRMMNIFFVYYNGPRFHKGIGRVPSEVIAVVG